MLSNRLAVIMFVATSLLLVVSCEGATFETEPAVQEPERGVEDEQEVVEAPEAEETVAELQLDCESLEQPGPGRKPALSLAGREPGFDPLTWTSERVIGFAFDEGDLALIFSPASGYCTFDDPEIGQVAGVVYVARDPGQLTPGDEDYWLPLMVTVVPGTDTGYLIEEDLATREQINYGVTDLEQIGDEPYPIDGAIRSDGLCIQMQDENGIFKRFCSSGDGRLSVRDTFGDAFDAQVAGVISEAEDILLGLEGQLADEILAPLLEGEGSVREKAISEIVSGPYIEECSLEECPADIVIAPFVPASRSMVHLGVLSVRRTLFDPDGGLALRMGVYIVHADMDDDGQPVLPLFVSGFDQELDEPVEFLEIPSSLASLVDPDTADAGEAAISGCRFWKACLFWESRC